MISEKVLRRQILRLLALRPHATNSHVSAKVAEQVEEIRLEEWTGTLRKVSRSDDHLIRIVDSLVTYEYQPLPKDIIDRAEVTPLSASIPKADPKCKACQGTGQEPNWRLETHERQNDSNGDFLSSKKTIGRIPDEATYELLRRNVDGHDQIVIAGVIPCKHCDHGRALRDLRSGGKPPDEDLPVVNVEQMKFEERKPAPAVPPAKHRLRPGEGWEGKTLLTQEDVNRLLAERAKVQEGFH